MPTRNSGMLLQSTFGTTGNFEVVAPIPAGGLVHWWRANDAGQGWVGPSYFASGPFASATLIQSTYGNPRHLEVVGRIGGRLVTYWRDDGLLWRGPYPVASGVSGEPGFVQSSWGSPVNNFEVVAPLASGGLGHWWRDNNAAGQPWNGPAVFGAGAFQAAALVASSYGGGLNLEVVARTGGTLVHFWRGSDLAWRGPTVIAGGVTGVPAFIQGSWMAGNFEVVCPLAGGGMGHWWRDNGGNQAWHGPTAFGSGAVDAVGLVQSSYGGGKNFEVVARRGGALEHWWRDSTTQAWNGPTVFSIERTCNGPIQGDCRVDLDSGIVAIHAALLRDRRVLVFGFGDDSDMNGESRVLDPANGALAAPFLPHNLFCAGQAHLPDGSVFVAGGHHGDVAGLHRFDPGTGSWQSLGSMPHGRWYPTCTALPDGRVFVISGTANGGPVGAGNPVNNTWQVFSPPSTIGPEQGIPSPFSATDAFSSIDLYPFCYLLPSGKLCVHSRHTTRLLDPATGAWDTRQFPTHHPFSRTYPGQGTSVLLPLTFRDGYRPRVLVAGGGGADDPALNASTPATATAEILDLGAASPAWRSIAPMRNPRVLPDSILLPDGRVAVVGGSATGRSDHATAPVFEVEIFDPALETWTGCCPMRVPRLYHSTALLLPDGRVMIAGKDGVYNDPPYKYPEHRVELFSPPYLFMGPRPTISLVPGVLPYGGTFALSTPEAASVSTVVLIRAAAVTHGFNMDQRLVELQITARGAGQLTVAGPPNTRIAPKGLYLLFILQGRVPSIAAMVTL